jgi:SAM-dependent methyltransferase
MTSQQPSQPNFDHVARVYRFAEYLALGPLLQRTRTQFLPDLPPRHQAVLLGDGDGRFLARLLARQPHLSALAVDTSATMLQLLRHRCQPYIHRVRTLQASALDLFASRYPEPSEAGTNGYPEPSGSGLISPPEIQGVLIPDLIVTHFFLDCLTQPELTTLTQNISAHTAPGTLWLLSDFALPQRPILRALATLYIRFLYLAFRILTGLRVTHLPDPQSALTSAGFTRLARHELLYGLLYTEIWQLH